MTALITSIDSGADGRAGPVWTVATVAHRLGIAPSTLRTWSHRYGIGPEGHHHGQRRHYTPADVAELDTIRRLVDDGIVLAAAAAMAHQQRHPPQPTTDTSTDTAGGGDLISTRAVARLVAAARRLDPTEATAIVAAALAHHGVVTTWDTVCRPAMTDPSLDAGLGAHADTDIDGGDCVDAMLLLRWAVTTSLRRLPVPPVVPTTSSGPGAVLLACAAGEHHTLGLEALHAALIERCVDARMLGSSVPDFALLTATARLRPATVVVWAQTADTAAPALLHALDIHGVSVVAAGPGWGHSPPQPPVTRAGTLLDALALCVGEQLLASG